MFVREYPLLKGDRRNAYVDYQGKTGVRGLLEKR